jgi:DHA2 family multidrug resistance protein-like MFS transporter
VLTDVLVGVVYVHVETKPAAVSMDLLRIPVFALSMGTSIGVLPRKCWPISTCRSCARRVGCNHLEAGMLTAWPLGIVVV